MLLKKRIHIDKQELYELYIEKRMSTKELGRMYGVASDTIVKRLHDYNIPVRHSSEINRRYKLNENYFDVINTKEKAYLLGLICADGWIADNKRGNNCLLGLAFQQRDFELLEFVKTSLEATNPIKPIKNNSVCLTVHSVTLVSKLQEYGIIPNKSLTLNIEDVINKCSITEDLIPSFILGYFDGDGGIYSNIGHNGKTVQWVCGFTGTYETCLFLKRYFNVGFIVDEKSKNGNTYTYKGSGRNVVDSILGTLYNSHSNSFYLSRKKDKFLELKSPLSQ